MAGNTGGTPTAGGLRNRTPKQSEGYLLQWETQFQSLMPNKAENEFTAECLTVQADGLLKHFSPFHKKKKKNVEVCPDVGQQNNPNLHKTAKLLLAQLYHWFYFSC